MAKWLTTEEVAAQLEVTRQYVSLLARTGKLRAYRGKGRLLLFAPSDVQRYITANPTNRNPQPLKGTA